MAGKNRFSVSDRFEYLQGLVTEFQDTDSDGGLCNLSMELESRDQILQSGGVPLVISCLSSSRDETVLSAITTLMNLITASSRSEITDSAVVQCMLRFSHTQNPRLRNLACVFLQEHCTQKQVDTARHALQGQSQSAVGIPLPKD
ncbi:armadillo repeat-containing protein 7 isoform X1 [Danio rerio]|uniref:Armadillo repeat-containing protein 7 isoform X1 n=1 Tax=Danio rerio TaxID=7955 RepID=A0AC58GW88_DANRE|nr:armadillo repeat-containing protein 7 isoform X1 [Danio rerio]|eukprot:XP_009304939.1 armadillo repeat-containing protein 7 isoform X1 [Danio rerio]